jgi:polar amino acid transport system substrate-binding protein
MSTRFGFICGVLAVAVVAATACDQPPIHAATLVSAEHSAPTMPTSPSPPPGQRSVAPHCNLRASLRPQGPLPAPGQMPAGSMIALIIKRGFLIAGVDQDTQGFAFRDENLRLQGFDIDIVRDITEAIFGNRERVMFRPLNVADRISTVSSGDVDLLVATATMTCRRRDRVDFSTVYYEPGQRVLVNRGSNVTGLADLGGKRVCASRSSTSLSKILTAVPRPIPVGVPTPTDCLMMLQLGEVDAVSTDDTLLAGMTAQDPRTEIVGPRLTDEPYGVEINKSTPDLVRFVNAVLERRVQDGRWQASYQRWLTPLGPPPPPPTPQYRD